MELVSGDNKRRYEKEEGEKKQNFVTNILSWMEKNKNNSTSSILKYKLI